MLATSARAILIVALLWPALAWPQGSYMVSAPSIRPVAGDDWVSIGPLLSANDGTSATTWAPTTSATLESGNVAFCVIGKDETGTGTTDGTGNAQFTSATDAASNTWVEAQEWCNMQTSTAANGACSAIYYTKATSQLNSGSAITFTFSAATTRKAASCWEFGPGGSTIDLGLGTSGLANDGADPGLQSVTKPSLWHYLYIRSTACEALVTTYTPDGDYTPMDYSSSTSSSGTAATSMGVRGEFKIARRTVSDNSDPTYVAADCASLMMGFEEY